MRGCLKTTLVLAAMGLAALDLGGSRALAGTAETPEVMDLPDIVPAFPGAWGFGMFTEGGRGGRAIEVTNLNDSGPGSFREAVTAGEPRTVVFRVAGIVNLESPINIDSPYLTIAGQTAPGDGVCIAGESTLINSHDVIVRHMRFRRGVVGRRDDALGGNPRENIVIDHCSTSWGLDENLSIYRYVRRVGAREFKTQTRHITIQWTISSEALNPNNHGFGGTWGGRLASFHHNLFACNTGRNPSIGWGDLFDYRNNVIFNWRHRTMDGGDGASTVNVIANYYKPGPATGPGTLRCRIVELQTRDTRYNFPGVGRFYVAGNYVAGDPRVTADNWDGGVQLQRAPGIESMIEDGYARKPFAAYPIPQQTAEEAYASVLEGVGATLPVRDAVDRRIIEIVRTGKPSHGNGIITDPNQVGGYPEYKTGPVPADADHDGMPDAWETKYGLDPNDPSDGPEDKDNDKYTNLEEYLNNTDPAVNGNYFDLKNNICMLK